MLNVGFDSFAQVGDTAKASASNRLGGDFGEEAFHQIDPGTAGGGEMDDKARMAKQPALHARHFVGGVVVHDQMEFGFAILGIALIDALQKSEKLLMAMFAVAVGEHSAGRGIIGGKEREGAVTNIIVSLAFRLS